MTGLVNSKCGGLLIPVPGRNYAIYKYPVTWRLYLEFCRSTGRLRPQKPSFEFDLDHPVVNVSWVDAFDYCKFDGSRLPTREEWEYAASGPEKRTYPWGKDEPTPERAAFNSNGTRPVGERPLGASWCGAHDMVGNVREWCADLGHDGSDSREICGLAWCDKEYPRSEYHAYSSVSLGFRPVVDLAEPVSFSIGGQDGHPAWDLSNGIPIKRPGRIGSVLLRGIEIAGRKELFGLIVIDGDWIKVNLREEQRRAAVLCRNTPNNDELKERLEMLGQFQEVLIQREDVDSIFLCRDGNVAE